MVYQNFFSFLSIFPGNWTFLIPSVIMQSKSKIMVDCDSLCVLTRCLWTLTLLFSSAGMAFIPTCQGLHILDPLIRWRQAQNVDGNTRHFVWAQDRLLGCTKRLGPKSQSWMELVLNKFDQVGQAWTWKIGRAHV